MKAYGSLIAFLLASVTTVNAIVIDDFTEGSISLQATNYSPGVTAYQANLNPNAVIGGERNLYAGSLDSSRLEIDSNAGVWAFEATESFGYFEVGYGTMNALTIDLRADGSDAFLLSFSEVYTPGIMRGSPFLRINGIGYGLRADLMGMSGGPVAVRVPFSVFSTEEVFAPESILFAGGRIEPTHRFVLDSITTVPEPSAELLLLLVTPLIWRLRKPKQPVEQNALHGWQR